MKILKNYCFQAVVCLMTVLMMHSCSCSEKSVSDRLDLVASDKVDFVATGNIKRALDELEIKVENGKLELPQYLWSAIDMVGRSASEKVEEGLEEFKGLQYSSVVVVGRVMQNDVDAVVSFGVDDVDALYDFLNEINPMIDLDKSGDYTTIGTRDGQMLIQGQNAFAVIKDGRLLGGHRAVRELEKWFADAKEKPLASWKRDYLTKTSVYSYWVGSSLFRKTMGEYRWEELEKMTKNIPGISLKNLSLGMWANLDGNKAVSNVTIFNGDKVMKTPVGVKFDNDLVKYATEDDWFAVGVGANSMAVNMLRVRMNESIDHSIRYYENELNNYAELGYYDDGDEIFSEDSYYYYASPAYYRKRLERNRAMRTCINEIFDSFDGSIFLAVGPATDDFSQFVNNPPSNMHFVLAGNTKPDKAKKTLEALVEILKEEFGDDATFENIPNGVCVYYEPEKWKRYVQVDGNNIVLSSEPVNPKGKNRFDKSVFSDTWVAAQLLIERDTELANNIQIPFGVNANGKAQEMSFDFEAELSGTRDKFFPAVFKFFLEAGTAFRN